MAIQQYNFPDHTKGDTFDGVTFTVKVNGAAKDLTGASLKMDVRGTSGKQIVRYTSNPHFGLTLTTPASGIFNFDKQIIDLLPGDYVYDIEITFADATKKTWIRGTWKIMQDVTHD